VIEPDRRPRSIATLLRLHLTYLWCHRRPLSLRHPRLFTELIQRRKLIDRDPRLPQLIDKLTVKAFVADRLGREWVTPNLWSGSTLPRDMPHPTPFVVKSRHGCNQHRFVRSNASDWPQIRRDAGRWMHRGYGGWLDEWGYRDVPRGLLIEPFVGSGSALPIDYKFFVFHGRVAAVQIHLDRETDHRWIVFDRDWQRLSAPTDDADPSPPASLARMIDAAETLGEDFDFVRIDFYDLSGTPRFGEMTFYPGSGLEPVEPRALDVHFGKLWRDGAAVVAPVHQLRRVCAD
jgi:hypothetical protein